MNDDTEHLIIGGKLWERLRRALAREVDADAEKLLDLAISSVRDCIRGGAEARAEDRRNYQGFAALEALVLSERGGEVTIDRIVGTYNEVSVSMRGDTICRETLAEALLAMARAQEVIPRIEPDLTLAVREILWPVADPSTPWSSDTAQAIADLLHRHGLGPPSSACIED